MATLLHGTTPDRARRIVAHGPDPNFVEPGGVVKAESFSTYLESGPFLCGPIEGYACGKAREFPLEGGAAIVKVDVPDDLIEKALGGFFRLEDGLVQFDEVAGLGELLAAWPALEKQIIRVRCP